ncbi:MAG: hypothetical protein WCF85_15650 [Rhodospirillaceae bacterium]
MTPEKEAELFVKLDMLIEICRNLQAEQKTLGERVARVEGRIEEQSKFLQLAIGSKMTRKSAA